MRWMRTKYLSHASTTNMVSDINTVISVYILPLYHFKKIQFSVIIRGHEINKLTVKEIKKCKIL